MPHTRVIFQNLNLFVGPAALSGQTATGSLYTSGNSGQNLIAELSRVQSATLNASINRQDINEFGQLNRLDSVIVSPASISLDFSYYLTNGYNEYLLGFDAKGNSFLSGILTKVSDAKNYFISVSPQGIDDDFYTNPNGRDTYAIGNAYVTNYSINAAVGQVPTASVTLDAMNIVAYTGSSGLTSPAINTETYARSSSLFQLPVGDPVTGANIVPALRPGDISLSFPTNAGFLAPLSGSNGINVQSFTLSMPISREVLSELGSLYGFSREIQFPVTCTLAIRAVATDVNPNSFDQLLCSDPFYSLAITMRQPSCQGTGLPAMIFGFNSAKLTSYSLGNSIGSDSTVDLNFSAQFSSANSTNGITVSGYGVS